MSHSPANKHIKTKEWLCSRGYSPFKVVPKFFEDYFTLNDTQDHLVSINSDNSAVIWCPPDPLKETPLWIAAQISDLLEALSDANSGSDSDSDSRTAYWQDGSHDLAALNQQLQDQLAKLQQHLKSTEADPERTMRSLIMVCVRCTAMADHLRAIHGYTLDSRQDDDVLNMEINSSASLSPST